MRHLCDCGGGPPSAGVDTTGLDGAARVTMCLDDDCRDLDQIPDLPGLFNGFAGALTSDRVHIRVAVRDADGAVMATLDDTRKIPSDCCGLYLRVQDGDDGLFVVDYED